MLLCAINFVFAQLPTANSEATMEDYERYIDQRLEMNFRLNAMKSIELTPEEINAFNPVFDNYIAAKDRLSEKKFNILEEYAEEMEEEDDADDQAEETSDFIEDYWEAEIAEMELKKDYYDILENKIPYQKAIDFFLYEETVENGMKYDILSSKMPTIIKIETHKKERKAIKKAMKVDKVSQKDWNRYIDKRLEMDFRLAAIEEMYLTPEEINIFNPMFDQYMNAKENLTEKQFKLIDKYSKKIAKENDAEDSDEEISDFIEDYWETEIAALKLKETYFDRMENKLSYAKVAQFFLFEETVENRMKFDAMSAKMPSIILIEEKMKKQKNKRKAKKSAKDKMKTHSTVDKSEMEETTDKVVNKTDQTVGESKVATENAAMKAEEIAKETQKDMEKEESAMIGGNEKNGNSTMRDTNWDTKRSENTKKRVSNEMADKSTDSEEMKDVTVTTYSENSKNSTATTVEKKTKSTIKPFATELTTFNTWVSSKKGQMSLDHSYTHDGLMALTAAIEATAQATNTSIEGWVATKSKIGEVANNITIDPKSNMHADWVSEAFVALSDAVKILNDKNEFTYADGQVSLLQFKAKQINSDILLLKQSNIVYDYFATANQALKEIWNYAAKSTAAINRTSESTKTNGEE